MLSFDFKMTICFIFYAALFILCQKSICEINVLQVYSGMLTLYFLLGVSLHKMIMTTHNALVVCVIAVQETLFKFVCRLSQK